MPLDALLLFEIIAILLCLAFAIIWVVVITNPEREFKQNCEQLVTEAENIRGVRVQFRLRTLEEFKHFSPGKEIINMANTGAIRPYMGRLFENCEHYGSIVRRVNKLRRDGVSNRTINEYEIPARDKIRDMAKEKTSIHFSWSYTSRKTGKVYRKSTSYPYHVLHDMVKEIRQSSQMQSQKM